MIAALLFAAAQPAVHQPSVSLSVTVTALRNQRGFIRACITRDAQHFPKCERDPAARSISISATARTIEFHGLPAGRYALAIFHDENANGKLDTVFGIPREGFGFSRDPAIKFGPPRFDKVSIELSPGLARTSVRMQYLL